MPNSRQRISKEDKDDWLKNFIHTKVEDALNDEDGDVSELRQFNFNRFYGKLYGDEREGKSRFITREVFESVQWAMPSLLRALTSDARAVEFLADNAEDEGQAAQETDVAQHYIHKKNSGFMVLYNWLMDILIYPNGYVKCYPEEKERVVMNRLTGLTLLDLNALQEDPNVEILEAESYLEFVDGFGEQTLFNVRARHTETEVNIKIESIAPDETLIDDDWTEVDIEGCPFVCHRVRRSISELVEMGYDRERLEALGDTDDNTWNDERVNRLFYEEENPDADDEGDQEGAARKLWVHEMSIMADYDDDGVAERRRVVMIADEIFENEIDDYNPIVSCAAIPIPHKHIGMSYVETVQDLQRIATTVTRQMLDNIYAQTDKRHFFNESALLDNNETLDDYLDARSSAILVRGNPAEAVLPETTPPITNELLAVIEHIKNQTKLRTGVAPELSLDPAILKQSTEGAFANALDQASQRLELLVRLFAEIGYKRLMQKVQTCIRLHINTPSQVKIRGQWINFDPATWKDRTKMEVNVGLGHNTRENKLQLLTSVLDLQREALEQNLTDPAKIYTTLSRLVEAANLGAPTGYFNDPSDPNWQPPQPAPDPQAELFQAQAQAVLQEQQRKAEESQQKAQAEIAKMQQQFQSQQEKFALERAQFMLEREKFEAQFDLESTSNVSKLRETNASTELKHAQATLAYSNAGKADADANKADIEASEEYRQAQDIIDNGIEGEKTESASP